MYVLILGANSDIAQAVARKFAKEERANLYLASRDMGILQKRAQDITTRYQVSAQPLYFDATDYSSHAGFYAALNPKPDGVVVAFGFLGNQKLAQSSFSEARLIIETNYAGAVSILEIIAADFERRSHGFIVGMSSVAGERGRGSNYIYGSAKGAFSVYLSGLRNRLARSSVSVTTVLLGFVDTKMTRDLALPKRLVATPFDAGEDIFSAIRRSRDVAFIKWYWKWIMTVIKMVPETFFKRLHL